MKKTYGIVIIGCGHIGLEHLEAVYYRDDVNLIGTVDLNEDTARFAARKFGAKAYGTDYKEYLNRDDVDIVLIATYAKTHLQILKDCLQAGKHVLCEKPIATNLADGRAFFEAAKASDSKVLIAHVLRHNATYQKAALLIQSGLIGEVRLIRMVQNHHVMDEKRYAALLRDCPPIIDCAVHYVDVIRWFTGLEIRSVGGVGARIGDIAPEDSYNYGMMTMELSNGGVAYYEAGWSSTNASQNLKEFIGDKGRLRITLQANRTSDQEEGDSIEWYDAKTKSYHVINSPSVYKNMYGQLECLIRMIEGEPGSPTMEDAYKAFCLTILGDRAIRERRVIPVTEEELYR